MQPQETRDIREEEIARIPSWQHVPLLKCILEAYFFKRVNDLSFFLY